MKQNIAILAGGDSSEWDVSMRSAEGIKSFLDPERYDIRVVRMIKGVWEVLIADEETAPIDKEDFSYIYNGKKQTFDFAYITIHGTPGENGIIQAYLELIGLPYSSCDVLTSALTMNKFMCNQYLKTFGLPIAHSLLIKKGDVVDEPAIAEEFGFPCFIKPVDGGSSFGVTKVKTIDMIRSAIELGFQEGSMVMVEEAVSGVEVSCGCYSIKDEVIVLPITELVSKNEFFDYQAKYDPNYCDEITPARLPVLVSNEVQMLTAQAYRALNCKGLVRIDFIIEDNDPILIEVNTVPGMTAASIVPQQVRAMGMEMRTIMTAIIEDRMSDFQSK